MNVPHAHCCYPRRTPGKRAPLWQQRQRSAQLLDVARKFPTFPILLETVRECLQDVYDLPALRDLFGRIARRQIRMVEVETATPSPFASSLLFDYVGAFMYEGDSPLAERRAAALSLDSTLLAELLGRVELRELLDTDVIAKAERELQRLTPERHARDVEGMADLLRLLGPVTTEEAAERSTADPVPWLDELVAHRRALRVSFAGRQWWTAVEDAARLRDGLGVPLPIGTPAAFIEPSTIRSAICSVVTRARTVRSRCRRPRSASESAPPSLATSLRDWRTRNVSSRASSGPARPAANGATPRCCADCGAARSRRRERRWSRSAPRRWADSCPAGSMSVARCADSTAW